MYAIIRTQSESGHSPNLRYDTYKQAVSAAKHFCEEHPCIELQVVKVLAAVSSKPAVRITRIK